MPASSRTVYGRAFRMTPVWMWWVQRVSGLLLGPLVLVHMWTPDLANDRALNAVLLAIVVSHGYSGIARLVREEHRAGAIVAIAGLWLAAVGVFGALIVIYGQA